MTKRFKRAGSVKDNYPPGRDFPCSKCGAELERLVKDEDGPGYRLNASGKCSNCGFRNNWFAKRGFAPGEGSKNTLSTKQKRHRQKRKAKKNINNANRLANEYLILVGDDHTAVGERFRAELMLLILKGKVWLDGARPPNHQGGYCFSQDDLEEAMRRAKNDPRRTH